MKKIFFIGAFIAGIALQAQVSTTRINDIKIGAKKSEIEKIIGKKVNVKLNEYGYSDTPTSIVYKGMVYEVYFTPGYDENGNELKDLVSTTITANHSSLKTLSGITIGSSLNDLVDKYKDYNIKIYDGYDEKTEQRSKKLRYFEIDDYDAGTSLTFKLVNGKVTEFTVSNVGEGC